MINFKQYMTEAKISAGNFSKAVDLIVSLLSKRTSHKFYRYGGDKGFVENKKGIGIMFFYDNRKAIRFNHSGGSFESITLWRSYSMGRSGDLTIDVSNLNIVKSLDVIVDTIINPKVGKKEFYVEDFNKNLTEARRISPNEFTALVIARVTDDRGDISKVPYSTIAEVAQDNDVNIPSVLHKLKSGPRGQKTYDLTQTGTLPKADAKATKVDPIYYVKVTAQDPDTKKFMTTKGDTKVQSMLHAIDGVVNNPTPKQQKAMRLNPNTLFSHMKNLIQVVARGKRNSLVITGGAGIGKTHSVLEALEEEGMVKNQDWFLIKGKITTASLYQMLYMHRKGKMLLFDDADSVWKDQEAANILKAALDSYDVRTVSWNSARTVNLSTMDEGEKEEFYSELDMKIKVDPTDRSIKFPSEFDYRGRIIFISNLKREKMDDAVLNRSAKIDMDLTTEEIFARIESILEHIGSKDVDIEAKKEIFEFIKSNSAKGKLDAPSIRTFVGAEDLYRSGLPNWRELMEYI